jgi:hypothetical protein
MPFFKHNIEEEKETKENTNFRHFTREG